MTLINLRTLESNEKHKMKSASMQVNFIKKGQNALIKGNDRPARTPHVAFLVASHSHLQIILLL